jgi:hypothetical protein
MRLRISTRLASALLVPALVTGLTALTACTATRTREFLRESYRAPDGGVLEQSRVFAATREEVWEELLRALRGRGAEIEDSDPLSGRIVADLRFRTAAERDTAVRMGSLRQVVTRTRRRYRSYWPLDLRCDECIIRKGNVVGSVTELVEDRLVPLSPGSYRIDPQLRAAVSAAQSGTRVELRLEVSVEPRSPPGLAPASTGRIEAEVFEALEASLER